MEGRKWMEIRSDYKKGLNYKEIGLKHNIDWRTAKKMIVSRLMKEVRVKRDYEIEIDLTASCEALGISLDKPIVFKESS